jgi:CubicO group peptidase (beta-lactamase class C family)
MPVYMENWFAAGGMYSTTADLMKFANALYGGKLLSAASLDLMLTPRLDGYGFGYGLGNRLSVVKLTATSIGPAESWAQTGPSTI